MSVDSISGTAPARAETLLSGENAEKPAQIFRAATGGAFGEMSCHGRNMLGRPVLRFSNASATRVAAAAMDCYPPMLVSEDLQYTVPEGDLKPWYAAMYRKTAGGTCP